MKDAARHAVLGAIRHHLAEARREGPLPPDRDRLEPAPAAPAVADRDARVAAFAARLGSVGGRAWRVAGISGATDAVRAILAEHGAARVAFSDGELARTVRDGLGTAVEAVDPADRAALFACDAGVTGAQLAVAETGTVVLLSDQERHRLASLLPAVHVALCRTDDLVDTMAAALRTIHARGPAPAVTLITGPSRTADIGLTLVVGVHGPRHLHVVLVDTTDGGADRGADAVSADARSARRRPR